MADAKAANPAKPGAPAGNPALRMMGIPNLPRKLPSRNWMIFWTITGAFSAAIIYDKREKKRATAKWRHAVEHMSKETIHNSNELPRKLTVYLESAPGDGLRSAQDHFIEYAKPVLAASGLDWEFVQGRQQGDVRAAVAEKIRRSRKTQERPNEEQAQTEENAVEELRKRIGIPAYDGVKGDVVFGRNAWKEYVRGLHEGWLGPLYPPPSAIREQPPKPAVEDASKEGQDGAAAEEKPKPEEKKDDKAKRPPQPLPYNSPDSYSEEQLPPTIPAEFSPSTVLPFPHRLGFSHTFVRLGWFLNRRKLADEIGRDIAAVCFAASRGWREEDGQYEQQTVLIKEENNWPKSVFKEAIEGPAEPEDPDAAPKPPKEMIWASPLKVDSRVMERMRRFEILPEDEARVAKIVVPEEEVEGFIKGSLRSLVRWGVNSWNKKPQGPNVGNIDDE